MTDDSLREFTELTASSAPVPGGGGVSALAGSLAAALAEMVTNLTAGKRRYIQYEEEIQLIRVQAEELRLQLLDDIEADGEAFKPLAEAYRMDKDAPGRDEILEKCLHEAALPPLRVMEKCARIIRLDERLALIGSIMAVSDAAVSVMLAHGALYGAGINVCVNTRLMKDREYASRLDEQADELLAAYGPRALSCYETIRERLGD